MTRNWNKIRAKLTDPFDPDNEEVEQQIQAMIAKQDAQGGHVYPEFHLPGHHPSTSSVIVGGVFHLPVRRVPSRAESTETTPSTRKVADSHEASTFQPRKVAKLRDNPDSLASRLDSALTATKRAAFDRREDGARQRNAPDLNTGTNTSKLDQPLRGSKRKAGAASHDEEHGRGTKRRIGRDGRPTASPSEDYLDY